MRCYTFTYGKRVCPPRFRGESENDYIGRDFPHAVHKT